MKLLFCILISMLGYTHIIAQDIPLPEHPNPILKRSNWQNLNGYWDFQFDDKDRGVDENWFLKNTSFNQKILVPFPWGSKLSEIEDDADIGWYKKKIRVSSDWAGKRTFLIIGASDWETQVWLDGKYLGNHQGGYVPFEFEITNHITFDKDHVLTIRVDDKRRDFTLYGKQGYGNARGIWQTLYLEARGEEYLENIHVSPDIDNQQIKVTGYLPEPAKEDLNAEIEIQTTDGIISGNITFKKGQAKASTTIAIPNPNLWTLDDPHLYDIRAKFKDDILDSYFGMRKISVEKLPGTDYPYIALNNKPIYLQLALDQSYHPDGFYTFPSEKFIIEEIYRSKSIGLNGIRTHIKVEIPRKLYWADKLGLLVMEDLPNSWGDPEEHMQEESTYTLREMIKRDYNHPSIFSWVVFNETWGLFTTTPEGRKYLPETQQWVASMYHLAKSLDPTRLIEDNSICCGRGHTVTDINSWHVYLPGYEWEGYLKDLNDKTFIGSTHNYEDGFMQGPEPNINSECGNVWGYDGSAGDVDWSWDYHRMINTFRKYPKIGGWLYTEHHDVVNEWNGYWRFDRSLKETGLGSIVPDMTLNDLHSDIYITTGQDISYEVKGRDEINIPLFLSIMTDREISGELQLAFELSLTNYIGETEKNVISGVRKITYSPWAQLELAPLTIKVPDTKGLGVLRLILKTADGEIVHRNFVHLVITDGSDLPETKSFSTPSGEYSDALWTDKTWNVFEGKKVNGAGKGYFEYIIKVPKGERYRKAKEAYIILEASAKELFVKDQEEYQKDQDFMKGSRVAPSSNPNSYPMTDETLFPSKIKVYVNDREQGEMTLADDPADHRGVLSWHAQLQDRKLREAGSYGYKVKIELNKRTIRAIEKNGEVKVRLETVGNGGIAIYGKDFGQYPFDPTIVFKF